MELWKCDKNIGNIINPSASCKIDGFTRDGCELVELSGELCVSVWLATPQ